MNIWSWVYDRQEEYWENDPEFAHMISEFPSWVLDKDDETVMNALPVALQKCKSYEEPWLEVYFRHWHMQLKVLINEEVKDLEPEIVDLLNFAHKDEAKDCPQSICVVQDFCAFYSKKDGPAYADERKKIALESLEKITPQWSCFNCISDEYVCALLDEGKYEEALNFIKSQKKKIDGDPNPNEEFANSFAKTYNKMGHFEDTIKLLEKYTFEYRSLAHKTDRDMHLALAYSRSGRIYKARNLLPKFDTLARSDYSQWIDIKIAIADKGGPKLSAEDFDIFLQAAQDLENSGAYRKAFNLYKIFHGLYLKNGDAAKADEMISALNRAAQGLRYPETATEEIAELL